MIFCTKVLYASCTAAKQKNGSRIVKTAKLLVSLDIPLLNSLYTTRLKEEAMNIYTNPTLDTPFLNCYHLANNSG